MEPKKFVSQKFGRVIKTPGPDGFNTFIPNPIPRKITLNMRTVAVLSEADRALGRLAGAGRLLPNPDLLVHAYIKREAVASSRIEGTQATLPQVFDAEAKGETSDDVAEVLNYVRALNRGLERLNVLPISKRLVEEIHGVLLQGVRGAERQPGEIRHSPNWIGSPDNRPDTAVFVPPPYEEMKAGLSDWERFIHEASDIPPLIRCALMHYQFETLHPFLDGNGRLGRLLIIFFLVGHGHLPAPILYISSYFEDHKNEYYDRIQSVRERGEIQEWLQFFCRAIEVQAADAEERAEKLTDLREEYRERLKGTRSRAFEVVDLLLDNPVVTTSVVADQLGITPQGATNLLKQLESVDILTPRRRIPGRSNRWVAPEMLDVLVKRSA